MKYPTFRQKVRDFPVFSTSTLSALTEKPETLRVQLSLWKKKGLMRALRKGLYVLNPEDRKTEPSRFYLANQIFLPSYVSLESALAYHGLIPEFVAATTSVTTRKTCRFTNEFGVFTYQHVAPRAFTGFESVKESDKFSVLLATPEKAVVDFIYLNLSRFTLKDRAIFTESYRFQNGGRLSPARLRKYAKLFQTKKLLLVIGLFIEEVVK